MNEPDATFLTEHVKTALDTVKKTGPIAEYSVVCDMTNNSPESIAEGKLRVDLVLTGSIAAYYRRGLKMQMAADVGAFYDHHADRFYFLDSPDPTPDEQAVLEALTDLGRKINDNTFDFNTQWKDQL